MLRFWQRLVLCSPTTQHCRPAFSFQQKLSNMKSKFSTMPPHPLPNRLTPRVNSEEAVPPYTSGRWLNRDELELSSRHIVLDFSALGDKAISLCPKATKIVKCEKREGGFNRVFLLTMEKLPTSIAGPPRLMTNSEVATITYLQSKISLPIPKILDWNDDPSNPIGTEHIIQEHAVDVQLHQVWPEMNSEQHMLCTKMLSLAIRDMVSDFHKRNIYVSAEDPTVITSVLDWESTSIEPAFIYANETPDFAALPEEPEGNTLENGVDKHRASGHNEQEWKDASICYQSYDVCMKGLAPKLRPARLLDPTLFRVLQYCHTTWRDSAMAIRQELIELTARWTELGLQGSCPFSPTEEELREHARDYEDFETIQNLNLWLRNSLNTNSDGWVLNELWDAARDAHRAACDEWIQTARESESRGDSLTVANADKLSPFDAR